MKERNPHTLYLNSKNLEILKNSKINTSELIDEFIQKFCDALLHIQIKDTINEIVTEMEIDKHE
jgi:uncharacterized secreted protein with C-terminal beta-propeller domain